MEQFLNAHDDEEICLIQNDYDDSFNDARVAFYGVGAWPTIVGNGLSDAWPVDCLEGDYEANAATSSPLTIFISEEGVGQFTAHITAEENVAGASFFMVATLAEDVPSSSGTSYLPRHVKTYMTPLTGDPFTLAAGNSVEISYSFEVQAEWDYDLMGVAAWVSQPGGTNLSPCPYGDIAIKNEVLQSKWVQASGPVRVEHKSWSSVKSLYK